MHAEGRRAVRYRIGKVSYVPMIALVLGILT